MSNHDQKEIAKFDRPGAAWWGDEGEYRTLRDITPARASYVARHCALRGRTLLDVGCGGGIFSEAMAEMGAAVTGIDAAATAVDAARVHAGESGLEIDYRLIPVESLAGAQPGSFDIVTCMELLEHVPDPRALVQACVQLTRPGGQLFFGTINRTPAAYGLAVLGAEYLLGLLPRGTHEYARFLRPSELAAWLREAGAGVDDVSGLSYQPLLRRARLSASTGVNYLLCAHRAEAAPA